MNLNTYQQRLNLAIYRSYRAAIPDILSIKQEIILHDKRALTRSLSVRQAVRAGVCTPYDGHSYYRATRLIKLLDRISALTLAREG